MKLLEYKAKELFEKYGIPVQKGVVVSSIDGIKEKIQVLNFPVVVKAQVQVGGRGKAGGIKFADSADEAVEICKGMLHSTLKGLVVNELLIVEKVSCIAQELYLSIMLDRLSKSPMIIFSANGGVDIEETARTNPEKIIKLPIDPLIGVKEYIVRYIADRSGLDLYYFDQLFTLVKNLYRLFMEYDCMLAEINPLVLTDEKNIIALDGKVDIDDSALYRLPDILEFRESMQEDPLIKEARKYRFLYIPLEEDGNIAVMSNGSGMIMSCIDLISKEGLKVGAALDLGGGATSDRIAEAVRIVLSNKKIKALFISIFGGITRCDEVAGGVKKAMEQQDDDKIVIIRIEGTNKEAGLQIIKEIKGDITAVDSIREGVRELVERRDRL